MHMLLEADSVDAFEALLEKRLCNKEKIMGFGHRVYMKKMDPRALVMKNALKELCALKGDDLLYRMCEAGETIMEREKGLYPNLRLLRGTGVLDAGHSDSIVSHQSSLVREQ